MRVSSLKIVLELRQLWKQPPASLILAGPNVSVSIPAADKTSLFYFALVDYVIDYVTDQYGIRERIKRNCDPDAPEQYD